MAGPGEHPSGGIEGKQSRNPDRTEAQGDPERPQERRTSESHHHCQVGQRIQAEPYHCAVQTKDHKTTECLLEHSNPSLYLPH